MAGVTGGVHTAIVLQDGGVLGVHECGVLTAFRDRPHVFNLGHGIGQHTPIAHVEQLIARVRRTGA